VGALDDVEWETCLLEPLRNPAVERSLRKQMGFLPPALRYYLDAQWILDAAVALDSAHLRTLYASPEMTDMVALVVSQESSCRYCYAATRSAMRILGVPEARIQRLEEDSLTADLDPIETLALDFARAVARAVPLPRRAQAAALLDAGYPADGVKELACLAAINIFFNRLSTLPALPPEQVELPHPWILPLARWRLARFLRPHRATQPTPLSAEQRHGPFAPFVTALDGLPAAPHLRVALDTALQPSALGLRLKGLVFAVVARGVGCARSEAEAVQLLHGAGMSSADIEHTLAHLSAPDLDPLERAALSLARESIWFRPAPLQRHLQTMRPLFSHQQFVELIGIAALANTVCRLAVAVDLAEAA
jgi:alkylhydroperoxidase family enzyme